jgi:signal transduction histidine kinase
MIEDTGEGIDEAELENILKPFTRVNNNALVTKEGTGLGLSIVNSLVALHHGKLIIQSKVHKGTLVSIKLTNE